MARKFTSGAEYQSIAADIEIDSTSGLTVSIDTAIKRSGAASWKFVSAATSPFITRQYTSANGDSHVRVPLYVQSMTTAANIAIALLRDATSGNNASIRLNRDGASTFHLELWDEQASAQKGSDSATLNTNTWYRLEFEYIRATGVMNAYIDGVLFATGTGTANLNSNTLRWGVIDVAVMTVNFDDIAVNDSTGSFQNGLPGDGKVIRLNPNNSGDANSFATQTGGTAGAGNNYTRINETVPDDATTFNGSSTLNQEDLVNFDPSGIGATDTVNVVEVWARFRNSTADATAALKVEIEKTGSGTISQSATIVPNSTTWRMNAAAVPKTPPHVLYQDPDAAAWTQATLDTLQAGYKLTTAPGTAGRRVDVTNIVVIVDYTPLTVTSRTTTGVGRITQVVLKTTTGVARLQKATSQTITGLTRVTRTVAQTIMGMSRLTAQTTRTQLGKTSILRAVSRDQTGVSRVNQTTIQIITGLSNITSPVNQPQTGRSRVTAVTLRSQNGLANILKAVLTTIAGVSRIQKSVTQTQAGASRIRKSMPQFITGIARVMVVTPKTITGTSRLQKSSNQIQTGTARIQTPTTQTILGTARITKTTMPTTTGVSRVLATTRQTTLGVSRIIAITTRNQSGVSSVQVANAKNITGVALVRVGNTGPSVGITLDDGLPIGDLDSAGGLVIGNDSSRHTIRGSRGITLVGTRPGAIIENEII